MTSFAAFAGFEKFCHWVDVGTYNSQSVRSSTLSMREKELYNINETDTADIKAIHTADCKAVCHACPAIVADENDRNIGYW